MAEVNIYLTFENQCEAAFNFYKDAFGKEFAHIAKFGDMPPQEGQPPIPEAELNKVMHVSLPISKETIIMGSDVPSNQNYPIIQGNNYSISINTYSTEEADNLFGKLSADGKIIMAMNKTFWGAYFGMFTDKFGINWMINYDEPRG